MDFNGTIIITDPGHFTKDEDWGIGFDIEDCVIESSLGFSNYIWQRTTGGDGSWSVLGLDKILSQLELEEHSRNISGLIKRANTPKMKNDLQIEQKKETPVGTFVVDSGTFGIFYLDEVLKYCPTFLSDLGNWCYTIIPNFIGNIEVVESGLPGEEYFTVLGVGNKTFYTR